MPSPNFLIGAGLAATVAFLLWPEITGGMKHATSDQRDDQRRFERQARAAQDVTATGDERDDRDEQPANQPRNVSREEDERISAQKDYRGDPGWRARNSSERNVVCRWVPIDWEWEEYRCHDYFERPMAYQPGSRGYHKPQRREPKPQFVRYGPNVTACRRGGCPYNGG
jgi:hypothetical protein